ncbi:XdhC family protein [Halorussus halophilus]|uniref:XdhC family protein n=1 Tax=Halorussus halophilus TaxID=2650975 RepID=UPI001300CD11|nr:XdhC/CoxI family protein [Halorussus halophilus]
MDDQASEAWDASTPTVRTALRDALDADAPAAVATVTAVEGSAYRRPGAKMVLPNTTTLDASAPETTGAITAGCLEGPVAEIATQVTQNGPRRETFDLTSDDDTWNFGLGCNGVIDVLVEPADTSFRAALDRLTDGERVALVTVVATEHSDVAVGARVLFADGSFTATDPRPEIPEEILTQVTQQAREFAEHGRSDTLEVETERGTVELFVDGLEPVPTLFVFGGGRDVRPVTRFAREAGFRVAVATARGAQADAKRFPAADRVVATHPTDLDSCIERAADTYAVLMSHNFVDDRLAVEALLDTAVPYVGLMGPRKRFDELRDALAEDGVELTKSQLDRISTPVGLDLGGGEPAQVALSVVSEVLAVSNDRDGTRLSESEASIHPRAE